MKYCSVQVFSVVISFLLLVYESDASVGPLKSLQKNLKKLIKGILKDSKDPVEEEYYEEHPNLYAVPSLDGYGYDIHGYDPHQHDHYDEGVDIYEIPKVWSGKIRIPNFFQDYSGYAHENHVVKGSDNRLGLRVAIPYLGDFQYMREIGPGKYIDQLGPGKFPYPGLNQKLDKYNTHGYYQPPHYDHHEPVKDHHQPSDYEEQLHEEHLPEHSGQDSAHGTSTKDVHHEQPLQEEQNAKDAVTEELVALLKNYPWHKRRR